MDVTLLIGRILFSIIFVFSGINHFAQRKAMVGYAQMMKAPAPSLSVPLSGLMIILGGLSIAFGYYAKIGAILLIIFLLPTTFIMHKFWGIEDKQMAQTQMVMFMKNLSMLGGTLIIFFFGSGPLSIN